jgi:ribonuclease P protein component
VLSAAHRLTDAGSYRLVIRTGRRAGSGTVVVHLLDPDPDPLRPGPRIGFVVSKAVGNAVVRNRVQRRLRHLAREQLTSLPGSVALVVRALPASAGASSAELSADLERCLRRVLPGRSS